MTENRTMPIPVTADRMGRFIGQLRCHEGVTLKQLAKGLCTYTQLGKIENGEREAGKQLADALFQRLGKPAELFERLLDWDEFCLWSKRQEIFSCLRRGEVDKARSGLGEYMKRTKGVLDRQFACIVEINCLFLSGACAGELLVKAREALRLTQPGFQNCSIDKLLLSQNEGRLLFATLRLREEIEGFASVAQEYAQLLAYFRQKRYESRERVCLYPYVACRVIEHAYRSGNREEALAVCEDALTELTREKRLFAYDQLLLWKQALLAAMGGDDRSPEMQSENLGAILSVMPEQTELLIPCDEWGHVYCINHVIRDRRRLLGISQEALAEGICDPRTISRIENRGRNIHRANRQQLLQRVNMSGERYDYEVITDHYEDYLLRSELDRAVSLRDTDRALRILSEMSGRIPDIPANQQYLSKVRCQINEFLPQDDPGRKSDEEVLHDLETALALTLPLRLDEISRWPISILSINEILTLVVYATQLEKHREHERALSVLLFVKSCLKSTGVDVSYYEDVYTRVETKIACVLGNSGRCEESIESYSECLRISLENRNSQRLAQYLYGIACNRFAVDGMCGSRLYELLRQAYTAAQISGDLTGQRCIAEFCRDVSRGEPAS